MQYWCILLISLTVKGTLQSSASSIRYGLQKDLLVNYSVTLPPRDYLTYVNVSFALFRLINFDDQGGKLTTSGIFQISWNDPRIAENWKSSKYSSFDVETMHFSDSEVWTPTLVLINLYDRESMEKKITENVAFRRNGDALLTKGDVFMSECKADYTYFPYDTQTCNLNFTVWGYYFNEVIINTLSDDVDLNMYEQNNLWRLQSTRMRSSFMKSSKHPEHVGEVPLLQIDLVYRRRPTYYVMFLVMPIVLMEILQIFVFLLPWDCGERVGFSTTILLSVAVYLTIVTGQIPKSTEPNISILALKLFSDLCIGCMIQLLVIISLKIYSFNALKDQKINRERFGYYCLKWAQTKDWIVIGYRVDMFFVLISVSAATASSLYMIVQYGSKWEI